MFTTWWSFLTHSIVRVGFEEGNAEDFVHSEVMVETKLGCRTSVDREPRTTKSDLMSYLRLSQGKSRPHL